MNSSPQVNRRSPVCLTVFAVIGSATLTLFLQAEERRLTAPGELQPAPLYVGAAVCITCHAAEEQGAQARRWTGSQHAQSYMVVAPAYPEMIEAEARGMVKVLQTPEITRTAKRLGVETNCLSCHGTAADVDAARRAPTFHIEDGVQCEACHGPGSRHAAWRRNAPNAGTPAPAGARLRLPAAAECLACHREKPSHAILKTPPFNYPTAWKAIAHPLPKAAADQ